MNPGREGYPASAPTAIPPDVLQRALLEFENEYAVDGSKAEVVAEGQATMAEWVALEPSNTQDVSLKSGSGDEIVYAAILQGDFQVVGPLIGPGSPGPVVSYTEGRIVFDSLGNVLLVQLRPADAKGAEPFGDPAYLGSGSRPESSAG